MEKQRKQKQKKKNSPLCRVFKPKHLAKEPVQVSSEATLPSAKVLALSKDLKVCRVPALGKKATWPHLDAGTLPSARIQHSAKRPHGGTPGAGTLPSVGLGHSAKLQTLPSVCG